MRIRQKTSCALVALLIISTFHARAANQPPVVSSASVVTALPVINMPTTLTANATDPQSLPITYNWSFGDNLTGVSSNANITHTYTTAGSFTATCTVSDQFSTGNSASVLVRVSPPNNLPPTISTITASPNPAFSLGTVTFTASGADAENDALSFTWNFADGSPPLTTSSATVTHSFPTAGTFNVSCAIADTFANGNTAQLAVTVVQGSSGNPTIPANISLTDPPIVNPLNGITIQVTNSGGGLVQLLVNVNALVRSAFNVSTEFDGLSSANLNVVTGTTPSNRFVKSGLYTATSSASDATTGVVKGKARKTLIISRLETGESPLVPGVPSPAVKKFAVTMKKSTGKLGLSSPAALTTPRPDIFTFSGTFELPEGLDLSNPQDFSIGIGNILDHTTVDTKGRGMTKGDANNIKNVQIRYPRLAKGTTKTTSGQFATLTVTLSTTNMVGKGFDTEGVSAKPASNKINIQFGMLLAGVPYEFTIPATLKVAANQDSVAISATATK